MKPISTYQCTIWALLLTAALAPPIGTFADPAAPSSTPPAAASTATQPGSAGTTPSPPAKTAVPAANTPVPASAVPTAPRKPVGPRGPMPHAIPQRPAPPTHRIEGPSMDVNGQTVSTWALADDHQKIVEVAVTVPDALLLSPPTAAGSGPGGAQAVVEFPAAVMHGTLFNHFELHWYAQGHPPKSFQQPCFGFDFFGIPVDAVRKIKATDTAAPNHDAIAPGYVYSGTTQSVPEFGVRAFLPADTRYIFADSMQASYYGGHLIALEPTATQTLLAEKKSFMLSVRRPRDFGRTTLFPAAFFAQHDDARKCFNLIFSAFRDTDD
ncbi:MAG: hypothetical protein ACLQVD_09025 [Capsulimonadaceae bacterium]